MVYIVSTPKNVRMKLIVLCKARDWGRGIGGKLETIKDFSDAYAMGTNTSVILHLQGQLVGGGGSGIQIMRCCTCYFVPLIFGL